MQIPFFSWPAIVILVVIPNCWILLVGLARMMDRQRTTPPNDRQEKLYFLAMVLPLALGFVILFIPQSWTSSYTELPAMLDLNWHDSSTQNTSSSSEVSYLSFSSEALIFWLLFGTYSIGIMFHCIKFIASLWRIFSVDRNSSLIEGNVYQTHSCVPPFASPTGKVILPTHFNKVISDNERDLIIAHERSHISRRDPIYFIVLSFAEVIFWINPAIRFQTKACRIAAELDCDKAVLDTAPSMQKAYANTLVKALKHSAGNALPCAPAFFSPRNNGEYRMRITEIMRKSDTKSKPKLSKKSLVILGLSLCITATQLPYAQADNDTTDFAVFPLEGRLTSGYGMRRHPISKKLIKHKGIDIGAPMNTPIYAPAAGLVVKAESNNKGYGNLLVIEHNNGYVSRYGQLNSFEVKVGKKVSAGDLIARVGSSGNSTGPHLHFELWQNGEAIDPATMMDIPERKTKD